MALSKPMQHQNQVLNNPKLDVNKIHQTTAFTFKGFSHKAMLSGSADRGTA